MISETIQGVFAGGLITALITLISSRNAHKQWAITFQYKHLTAERDRLKKQYKGATDKITAQLIEDREDHPGAKKKNNVEIQQIAVEAMTALPPEGNKILTAWVNETNNSEDSDKNLIRDLALVCDVEIFKIETKIEALLQ